MRRCQTRPAMAGLKSASLRPGGSPMSDALACTWSDTREPRGYASGSARQSPRSRAARGCWRWRRRGESSRLSAVFGGAGSMVATGAANRITLEPGKRIALQGRQADRGPGWRPSARGGQAEHVGLSSPVWSSAAYRVNSLSGDAPGSTAGRQTRATEGRDVARLVSEWPVGGFEIQRWCIWDPPSVCSRYSDGVSGTLDLCVRDTAVVYLGPLICVFKIQRWCT